MLVQDEPGPLAESAAARWDMGARSYEIAVERLGRGDQLVHVNGRAVNVSLLDPRRSADRRVDASPAGTTGPLTVRAPMPGRVVKVLVQPGDLVAARQGVVVVEAMKMENELRATRSGTVTEVRAREGQSVEAGTVLVVVH
jgi:pyruvate carboxylase subunit B